MTQSQKIACRLRWVLLVLWILCFAGGCLYVFGVIGKAGIAGTPSIAIFGLLYPLEKDSDKLFYVFSLIYTGLFVMTQWLFLSPRQMWKIKFKPSGRPMKRAAVGAAFAAALLSIGLLYSVMDLFGEKAVINMGDPSEAKPAVLPRCVGSSARRTRRRNSCAASCSGS